MRTFRIKAIIISIILINGFCISAQNQSREHQLIEAKTIDSNKSQTFSAEIIEDLVFIEGDICIGHKKEIITSKKGAIIIGGNRKWPNATIPYEISNNHIRTQDILNAIDAVNTSTNLCLIPRSNETDYVEFVNSSGCWSYIGKQTGKQLISITNGCAYGSIIHEICHAAGMYHEQSRMDRDDYISINWNNIQAGKEGNFNKYSTGSDEYGYDYESIMHYSKWAFSSNGNQTIEVLTPPATNTTRIGQRDGLSPNDILSINRIYPTPSNCTNTFCSGITSLTSQSGGFSDGSGLDDYGNNSQCEWRITPPNATSISLEFTSFNVENGYDYVYIYDGIGNNANLIGTFTGTSLPNTISSTTGIMVVKFESDVSVVLAGFDANYSSISSNITCYNSLPILIDYSNSQTVTIDNQNWDSYHFEILNASTFPAELFDSGIQYPACGNSNGSRLKVNIVDASGNELNSFCHIESITDLADLWFLIPESNCPEDSIFIEIVDEVCSINYQSNYITMSNELPNSTCFSNLSCYPNIVEPELEFRSSENYVANGNNWTRYNIPVINYEEFPQELFDSAPHLAACGLNTNSSRTWVYIYDSEQNYLYGFCALDSPSDLDNIWIAVPQGDCPPTGVFIQLIDRQCDITYTSPLLNLEPFGPSSCDDDLCFPNTPSPDLVFESSQTINSGGQLLKKINLDVNNYLSFDNDLFSNAPSLPGCGSNSNASRSWVQIFDHLDNYINGFCMYSQNSDLNDIWFTIPDTECLPEYVYIKVIDRLCNETFYSNQINLSSLNSVSCNTGCPDLIIESINVTNYQNSSINYEFTIKNIGTAAAYLDGPTTVNYDNVSIQAFLSKDTIFYNQDDLAAGGTILGVSPLGYLDIGNSSLSGSFGASLSSPSSNYPYLTLKIDWGESLSECNESNNTAYTLINSNDSPLFDCNAILQINQTDINSDHYRASQYIESNGRVVNEQSVEFDASSHVDLNPGFSVEKGGVFIVSLDGC